MDQRILSGCEKVVSIMMDCDLVAGRRTRKETDKPVF
jgi:hypothetical protein